MFLNNFFKIFILVAITFLFIFETSFAQSERFQVLLITKVESYPHRHTSISNGAEMFKDLGRKYRFGVHWTDNTQIFDDPERMNEFDVIVFMNSAGNILNESQKRGFQDFIRNGGNFVGIHGAIYTFFEARSPREESEATWQWYNDLIGAEYNFHPGQHIAVLNVEDHSHPSTAHLPANWVVMDEWYNFSEVSDDINVLLTIDENLSSQGSYPGDQMGNVHPMAWYQDDFEGNGARSFYTMLGHPEDQYDDPMYRKHIAGAVWWAATGIMLD
ncbi:ThuA domain-containing protein [Aliifodinibius sp. S!AR15-10]|uniref:ThuA domain-containing protein n=1 Tax=Aliifodinibius sp. S!AR15-10 TaxID=2950437 RepID=UPI0028583FE0|nr:ThuA domain-containing protein [Aliifodinibius sp. S!AR15-10]MDR8393613.1 ThuA domain-containing protein [Aliifodinibius sp. S!AR15-10]